MNIPVDKLVGTFKAGAEARRDSDVPVRVAVFVDASASKFLIDCVRGAFVPQTTAALVRVERLDGQAPAVKPDTDVSIVISCGADGLERAVQQIVVAGAPTVVLAESSVEAPFIEQDTRMLGLIAATDKTYLLETLARWILDRTDKDIAFSSKFPFLRIAAAMRAISSVALTNMATGALVIIPGADFPVVTVAQLGMLLQLSAIFGKPLRGERAYEAAGVAAAGLVLRAGARLACRHAGRLGFVVKALVGGFGTYAIGRALVSVYERDVDYSRANEAVGAVWGRVRDLVAGAIGSDGRPVRGADAAA